MRTASHIYWLVWFFGGFGIAEAFGLLHPQFDTLTSTWKWVLEAVPLPAAIVLSGVLSAALLWLTTVHWIWQALDRPGLDRTELLILLVGFLSGVAGALAVRKRKQ